MTETGSTIDGKGFPASPEPHRMTGSREAELPESKMELSTLMNNLPGMVYTCLKDHDWTMKFVSKGSVDLT